MKRSSRDSLLVLVVAAIAAANAQMSGFGENGSGNGTGGVTDSDQSDSSEPLSTGALIGICVGGGVVLLAVLITALCMVCCIWKRRTQKSMALYDPEVYTADNKPSPPSSHHNSISSTMAARLLSTASSKAKKIPQPRDSDLTAAISAASNSNPLYNSSSIAYLPSGAQDGKQKMIAETPLSTEAPPIISVSSRRHSLGYVEMQSASSARPGIHASHSMENFTDSTSYASVRDGTGFKLPFAPPSYTPPTSSPLTSSLPTSRHHYLHPDRPPAPSPPHSHPHTPPTKKLKPKKRDVQEEDRGGEDDYVDPKLFLEDQERVQEEEDRPEDEYEEMKNQTDFFFSTSNTAYRNSTMSEDNPTADSAHQPHPATDHTSSSPTQPLYGNILPQDEGEEGGGGPYISDSYEPVNEFLGNAPETNERAALLATTDGRIISRTAPSTPSKHVGTVSTKTNKVNAQSLSRGLKESHSFDRKLSMDDQYVEVMSPVRKANSLKPRSARVTHDDVDLDLPELEYENVIPGTTIWGNENETESVDSLHATEELSVGGQGSSPREREQKTNKKSPSPTPKAKTSPKPKPKPKPHPSQLPPGKPRSKSHDAAIHTSTQPQMRIVVGGQSSSQDKTKPHLEEMVFPTHPVANGNVVTHNNITMGNGGVASRWRSTTVPVGGGEGGEGEEEEEGGEMLYVNVGDSTVDVGGEELYENVSSHDHLT